MPLSENECTTAGPLGPSMGPRGPMRRAYTHRVATGPWGGREEMNEQCRARIFLLAPHGVLLQMFGRKHIYAIAIQDQRALPVGSYGSQA